MATVAQIERNRNILLFTEAVTCVVSGIDELDIDKAQKVWDAFEGNALAALSSVIADAKFLCEQLETASVYLSGGIARGWTPSFERDG